MGGLVSSIVVLSAAFAAGIEIARRHPDNPWGYLKNRVSDSWDRFTSGPDDDSEETGEIIDAEAEEVEKPE